MEQGNLVNRDYIETLNPKSPYSLAAASKLDMQDASVYSGRDNFGFWSGSVLFAFWIVVFSWALNPQP